MMDQPALKIPLLVICGPTGSGKSALALSLASDYPIEIVCADSRQVYRMMDIGTAKATIAEQAELPHHMIDLIDPDQEYSVAEYVATARPLIADIHARGKLPCVVGGTGLYIRALLGGLAPLPTGDESLRQSLHQWEIDQGAGTLHQELERIDSQAAREIHPHNIVRIVRALEVCRLTGRKFSEIKATHDFVDHTYQVVKLAPFHPRERLYQCINARTDQMLAEGLVDEVQAVIKRYSSDLKSLQTLGYREVVRYLRQEIDAQQMRADIQKFTRQYAKKQLTWFRKEPELIWVDSRAKSDTVNISIDHLKFH